MLNIASGISYGTLIPSTYGLVPIEQLAAPSALVASVDGARPVVGVHSRHQHVRQICTRGGYQMTAARGQNILTLSQDGERVWTAIGSLRENDVVAIQRHAVLWGSTITLPAFEHEQRGNSGALQPSPVLLPSTLSVDLAYVLGLLVGDGSMRQPTSVGFTTADPELIQAVHRVVNSMGLKVVQTPDAHGYNYLIHSVVLKRWLNHLGFENVKAEHKNVPRPLLIAPQAHIRGFLQGLFDTDGSAEKRGGGVEFCSASPALAEQVHLLLLQFGIIGRLYFKSNAHAGAWIITLYGAEARKFYERVGFRLARKQERQAFLAPVSNSNIDVVPYLPPISFTRVPRDFRMYLRRLQSPGYAKLREMAEVYPELRALTAPEYFWDRVKTIHEKGGHMCMALEVSEPSTFVAHGFVCQAAL